MNAVTTKERTVGLDALRARVAGDVVLPDDEQWDVARLAWNLAVDQQPEAVVFAETASDVVATVRYARDHGLQVAPQGTGHGAAGLGPLEGVILLKTSLLQGVHVDPVQRRARVEAGVIWSDVVAAASEHGLAPLSGSAADVGVVGYTLGGGLGWLGRKHGLAANSVLAVELVTADGRFVRADRTNETDLFWALRGGGGSFGVVTAIEIRLYPVPELYAGDLFWPVERAREILRAWRDWVETVPEEVTSVGRILQLPPIEDIPEPFRGRSFVVVEAAIIGSREDGDALLAPLRALDPEIDTFTPMPPTGLVALHMDPPHPVPGVGDGRLLADLDDAAIDALLDHAVGKPLLSAELRHLGGALGRSEPEHGALDRLDAGFALYTVGMAPTPEAAEAVAVAAESLKRALEPWAAPHDFPNFSESHDAGAHLFGPETYRRLQEIKAAVDPRGIVRTAHCIPSASPLPQ